MDNDPYIIAFTTLAYCLPIHDYIIDCINNIITYHCGNNNTFIIPLNYIESIKYK